MTESQRQSADPVTSPSATASNRPPAIAWVIILPGLCVLVWAIISGLAGGSKSSQYKSLEEPAYTSLKRELEAEGVEVRDIRWKLGGAIEGVTHDVPAVGKTWVYLEVALHKPDGAEAEEARQRVTKRFMAYARSRKLGFAVHYVTFQFWSPASYIADVAVERY